MIKGDDKIINICGNVGRNIQSFGFPYMYIYVDFRQKYYFNINYKTDLFIHNDTYLSMT